ncbi:phosphoglycerate mutase-like protein [Crucibulum laeve]|uniref:Phosphoglycerate mutase-like protein n=1 Tax=Crucibulum laeve TaxID=68775 RepID=A0A5C3M3C9_9AGAR|nr:phosphoglycerate mutase-like protein [Crucibulum laeve]
MFSLKHQPLTITLLNIGWFVSVQAGVASTFAGSPTSANFPPSGAIVSAHDSFFPGASAVGFAGPTPTGDEADSVVTAPAVAKMDNIFPLIKPDSADTKSKLWDTLPVASVKSFGLPNTSPLIPKDCELSEVHLLHRHGARYPSDGSLRAAFAGALNAVATRGNLSASGPLNFINTWRYRLGAEILTPFGRSELFNLGVGFRMKYSDLLKVFKDLPVFRTASQARMVDSALHFAVGFFGVQDFQREYHQLITIEEEGFNNTLSPYFQCQNGGNEIAGLGSDKALQWADIYLRPAIARLGRFLEGYDLQVEDLVAMQLLCAYETNALGYSAFCHLFTEEEWKGFNYFIDLSLLYGAGPGNPASSAMGIGYVQEVVSRLTQEQITQFKTTVNGTIPIYVDATHDIVLSRILVAMNFTSLAANGPLPIDHIPENQISPFASNLVGQVLECPTGASKATHIRWLLNDAVLPLTGISGCKPHSNGLCELSTFITGMRQRIEEVDFWFDCFGNYTVPNPDYITNGQFPPNLRN